MDILKLIFHMLTLSEVFVCTFLCNLICYCAYRFYHLVVKYLADYKKSQFLQIFNVVLNYANLGLNFYNCYQSLVSNNKNYDYKFDDEWPQLSLHNQSPVYKPLNPTNQCPDFFNYPSCPCCPNNPNPEQSLATPKVTYPCSFAQYSPANYPSDPYPCSCPCPCPDPSSNPNPGHGPGHGPGPWTDMTTCQFDSDSCSVSESPSVSDPLARDYLQRDCLQRDCLPCEQSSHSCILNNHPSVSRGRESLNDYLHKLCTANSCIFDICSPIPFYKYQQGICTEKKFEHNLCSNAKCLNNKLNIY